MDAEKLAVTGSRESFTAADEFPVKLARDYGVIKTVVERGIIQPVHIQLCPTNRCTRNCTFCSCSERDKGKELPLERVTEMLWKFRRLGCKAITITGGGEPLIHPHIKQIVWACKGLGIKVGMVTNGDAVRNLAPEDWREVTWCRISCSDEVKITDAWWRPIQDVVEQVPEVDWAFSYVLGREPNRVNMWAFIELAQFYQFTHVRLVNDLLDYENVPPIEEELPDIAIYQPRTEPRPGMRECRISLLKPIIAADGKIYPCCGVQYAERDPSRDFSSSMEMEGSIEGIWSEQRMFDGSICRHCYYTDYNEYLRKLCMPLTHREFL